MPTKEARAGGRRSEDDERARVFACVPHGVRQRQAAASSEERATRLMQWLAVSALKARPCPTGFRDIRRIGRCPYFRRVRLSASRDGVRPGRYCGPGGAKHDRGLEQSRRRRPAQADGRAKRSRCPSARPVPSMLARKGGAVVCSVGMVARVGGAPELRRRACPGGQKARGFTREQIRHGPSRNYEISNVTR